jgi:hypothetical protein
MKLKRTRRELKKTYVKQVLAGNLTDSLLIEAVRMAQAERGSQSPDMVSHFAVYIQNLRINAMIEAQRALASSGMSESGTDAPGARESVQERTTGHQVEGARTDAPGATKGEGVNVHAIGQGEPTTERTEGTEAMTDTTGGHEVPGLNGEGTGTTGKAVKRTRKARRQRSRHEVPAPAGEGAGAD